MKLKDTVDVSAFLQAVHRCDKDVFFCSREGDKLNLKSKLSQFVFAALLQKPELIFLGEIVCEGKNDLLYLKDFLVDDMA